MSNSIDYTTISIQPRHASSKSPKGTTSTNNAAPAASEAAAATASWSRYVYGECQKNHAASMGRYVVDGCGEFMASGEEGSAPALKCAACQCHRSFHRRDGEEADCSQQLIVLASNQYNYPHHHDSQRGPGIMASYGPKDSSSKDLNMFRVNGKGREETMTEEAPCSKKRFRTKFSREQKVRMQQLAEELGWKIRKNEDEEQVEQLWHELGVKRSVFKVWMHNNKQKQAP